MPAIGMPDLYVRRFDRAGAGPTIDPRIALAVESYSWTVIGGPDKARIAAAGDVSQLWETIEWLGCRIEILDEKSRAVWWGFVQSVSVQAGAIEFGVSLETMANAIAVAYAARAAGSTSAGVRATTDWLEDALSIATYGRKELLISADVPNAATANALAATALAALHYPVPTFRLGDGESVQATIECVGWWATTDWRYFEDAPGQISYTDAGTHASYTARTISFDGGSDNINDSAGGLGVFAVGDAILVTNVDTRGVYTVDGSAHVGTLHVAEDLGGQGAGADVQLENHFATVGYNSAARKLAQSFVVPAGEPIALRAIGVYARTFDNPTSLRLYCELYTDNAGAPGTLLASGANARGEEGFSGNQEVPAAAPTDFISDDPPMTLTTFIMRDEYGDVVELTSGSTYWIVLDSDAPGGYNGAEFFVVQRNPAGSSPGDLKRWDGSSWIGTAGVLLHIVSGTRETTRQIADMVTEVLDFFAGSIIEDASGMFSDVVRDGDATARRELEELLATGTSTGRRLLATVTRERYLRVYQEPALDGFAARLGADGLLRDDMGNPIPSHLCPVGMWVRLVDVIPATADTSQLGAPSPFFVDRAEYSARSNRVRLEPKAAPSIRDIGKVRQG